MDNDKYCDMHSSNIMGGTCSTFGDRYVLGTLSEECPLDYKLLKICMQLVHHTQVPFRNISHSTLIVFVLLTHYTFLQRQKQGSCVRNDSRTAISTFSLLWNPHCSQACESDSLTVMRKWKWVFVNFLQMQDGDS